MNNGNRKLIGTILGIVVFVICIVSLSYAWYIWRSTNTGVDIGIHEGGLKFVYADNNILTSNNLSPVLDYNDNSYYENNDGSLVYADYTTTNTTSDTYKTIIKLNITSISDVLKNSSFKWILLDKTNNKVIDEGNFSNLVVGSNTLNEDIYVPPGNTTTDYRFVIYIDGNIENSGSMQGGSLISNLELCDEKVSIFNITLDNQGATSGGEGTNKIYEKYGVGIYKDSTASTTLMTTTTNNITKPSKTGYVFSGYYTEKNGAGVQLINANGYITDEFISTYFNKDTTLYAKWSLNSYNISYSMNGGTKGSNAPTSAAYDTDVQISNPTKTVTVTGNANGTGAKVSPATSKDQTFSGWTSSTSDGLGSNAKTGTSANPSTAWTGTSTKNTYFRSLRDTSGTVTLTANWTAVEFNLPTVTKTGYTCGWNTSSTGTTITYASGASYTPSANGPTTVTIYAVCTKNTYNISYNLNGGTKGSNAPTTATYDENIEISNPTKAGYTFSGWTATNLNTSTAKYGTSSSAINESWNNGDTKVTATYFKNLNTSGTVTLTANWSDETAPVASITSTNNVASSQTATLKCTDGVGVVSYYWGNTAPTGETNYTSINSTTSMSVTKTVNTSGTYYLSCKDEAGNTSVAVNKAFYKTTLTMANGTVDPTSVITMSGNSFNLPTPTANAGYTNNGSWYKNSAYTEGAMTYGTSYKPNSHVTLYSKAAANTYNITYNLNGGTQGTNAPTIATYDEIVNISQPTKTGYTFAGWTATNLNTSTAKYGTSSSAINETWSNGDTTVTATYFKNLNTSGTVTLTANWESINIEIGLNHKAATTIGTHALFIKYGVGVYLDDNYNKKMTATENPIDLPTKTGYSFGGYTYKDSSGNVKLMIDSRGYITPNFTSTTFSQTSTPIQYLEAVWTINKVSVEFHANGGTWGGSTNLSIGSDGYIITKSDNEHLTYSYDYGTTRIDLPNWDDASNINITKVGHVAKTDEEWNLKADGSGTSFKDTGASVSANDLCDASVGSCTVTLYVNWRVTTLSVIYNVNGGTLGGSTNTDLSGPDNDGNIIYKGNKVHTVYKYGQSGFNLANWNNPDHINITKVGYIGKTNYEWCNNPTGTGKCFDDDASLSYSDLCDKENDDCTVTLYVNWARNFTCNAKTETTKYMGLDWYTVENSGGVCTLALNQLVGNSNGNTYSNAEGMATGSVYYYLKALMTDSNKTKFDEEFSAKDSQGNKTLIYGLSTNSGGSTGLVDPTAGLGDITNSFWIDNGKIWRKKHTTYSYNSSDQTQLYKGRMWYRISDDAEEENGLGWGTVGNVSVGGVTTSISYTGNGNIFYGNGNTYNISYTGNEVNGKEVSMNNSITSYVVPNGKLAASTITEGTSLYYTKITPTSSSTNTLNVNKYSYNNSVNPYDDDKTSQSISTTSANDYGYEIFDCGGDMHGKWSYSLKASGTADKFTWVLKPTPTESTQRIITANILNQYKFVFAGRASASTASGGSNWKRWNFSTGGYCTTSREVYTISDVTHYIKYRPFIKVKIN